MLIHRQDVPFGAARGGGGLTVALSILVPKMHRYLLRPSRHVGVGCLPRLFFEDSARTAPLRRLIFSQGCVVGAARELNHRHHTVVTVGGLFALHFQHRSGVEPRLVRILAIYRRL